MRSNVFGNAIAVALAERESALYRPQDTGIACLLAMHTRLIHDLTHNCAAAAWLNSASEPRGVTRNTTLPSSCSMEQVDGERGGAPPASGPARRSSWAKPGPTVA